MTTMTDTDTLPLVDDMPDDWATPPESMRTAAAQGIPTKMTYQMMAECSVTSPHTTSHSGTAAETIGQSRPTSTLPRACKGTCGPRRGPI